MQLFTRRQSKSLLASPYYACLLPLFFCRAVWRGHDPVGTVVSKTFSQWPGIHCHSCFIAFRPDQGPAAVCFLPTALFNDRETQLQKTKNVGNPIKMKRLFFSDIVGVMRKRSTKRLNNDTAVNPGFKHH